MLVRLPEGVLAATHKKLTPSNAALCTFNFTLAFVLRYHLLSAAGVAGERKGREPRVAGDYSGADERFDKGYEARRVAAGVGDPLRGGYALAPALQFRKAVLPVFGDAMGRRRVDDHSARVLDERDRLPCSRVG